jgi:hypothetical protein
MPRKINSQLFPEVAIRNDPSSPIVVAGVNSGGSTGAILVDGSDVTQPVSVAVRTPTTSSVASSASSVLLLAANSSRRGLAIYNDSTALLRVSFTNPAAAANTFVGVPPGGFLLLDPLLIGTDPIYGIWAAANGTAQITEWA